MIDRWQRRSLLHHCALCHLDNFFHAPYDPPHLLQNNFPRKASHPYCTWVTVARVKYRNHAQRSNQESSSQDPMRLIPCVWHGCQHTDGLYQHAHINIHSCMHTHRHMQTHGCKRLDVHKIILTIFFIQLHSLDWHLFSRISSQLPAQQGKYKLIDTAGFETKTWHFFLIQ